MKPAKLGHVEMLKNKQKDAAYVAYAAMFLWTKGIKSDLNLSNGKGCIIAQPGSFGFFFILLTHEGSHWEIY